MFDTPIGQTCSYTWHSHTHFEPIVTSNRGCEPALNHFQRELPKICHCFYRSTGCSKVTRGEPMNSIGVQSRYISSNSQYKDIDTIQQMARRESIRCIVIIKVIAILASPDLRRIGPDHPVTSKGLGAQFVPTHFFFPFHSSRLHTIYRLDPENQ